MGKNRQNRATGKIPPDVCKLRQGNNFFIIGILLSCRAGTGNEKGFDCTIGRNESKKVKDIPFGEFAGLQ